MSWQALHEYHCFVLELLLIPHTRWECAVFPPSVMLSSIYGRMRLIVDGHGSNQAQNNELLIAPRWPKLGQEKKSKMRTCNIHWVYINTENFTFFLLLLVQSSFSFNGNIRASRYWIKGCSDFSRSSCTSSPSSSDLEHSYYCQSWSSWSKFFCFDHIRAFFT